MREKLLSRRREIAKLPLEMDWQQRRTRWLSNTSPRLRQRDGDGHPIEPNHSDGGVVEKGGRSCWQRHRQHENHHGQRISKGAFQKKS